MNMKKIASIVHDFLSEEELQVLKQYVSTDPQALVREIEKKEVEKEERTKALITSAVSEIQEEHLEVAIKKHGEKAIQEKGIAHFVDLRDVEFEIVDLPVFSIQQVLIRLLHSGIPFSKELVVEILIGLKSRILKDQWDEVRKHPELKGLFLKNKA